MADSKKSTYILLTLLVLALVGIAVLGVLYKKKSDTLDNPEQLLKKCSDAGVCPSCPPCEACDSCCEDCEACDSCCPDKPCPINYKREFKLTFNSTQISAESEISVSVDGKRHTIVFQSTNIAGKTTATKTFTLFAPVATFDFDAWFFIHNGVKQVWLYQLHEKYVPPLGWYTNDVVTTKFEYVIDDVQKIDQKDIINLTLRSKRLPINSIIPVIISGRKRNVTLQNNAIDGIDGKIVIKLPRQWSNCGHLIEFPDHTWGGTSGVDILTHYHFKPEILDFFSPTTTNILLDNVETKKIYLF